REELEPQLRLEREDLPAERRLRDVQLLCGASDVLMPRDDDEVAQALEVDHASDTFGPRESDMGRNQSWIASSNGASSPCNPLTRTTTWPCTNSDSSSPAPLSTRRCIA